ncbi:hypothetical protein ACQUFD_17400, partial [Enterococcus gallinarum]|uniref:hypothetical protein n=1 Tax=Enterococcus gallinarum TaxID=1353 RepID=UPI003D0DC447
VFFTNGVDTRTQGIDATASWKTSLGTAGTIAWDASLGYVRTTIRRFHDAPAALTAAGLTLADAVVTSNLTTATPRIKASLAARWTAGRWGVTL